jgi:hypothetical protein
MQWFNSLAEAAYEKLHEKVGFDAESREFIKQIVNNSVAFVITNLVKECETEEELKSKIEEISINTFATITIFVIQLEFFARADNNGPFFDLSWQLLNQEDEPPEDINDC